MKLKNLLLLSPFLLGMVLPFLAGCQHSAPTLAPTPAPQVIWANGSIGTWFTSVLTANCGACNTSGAVTAVADPISGDGNTLRLTTTATSGFYYFEAAAAANPSVYYPGHLQWDIRVEQAPASITSMVIEYVNYSGSGNCGEYDLPGSLINSFSTSSFTHVSIPLTSFTFTTMGCTGFAQISIDTPFQISWNATVTGTALTLDNIRWTAN